MKTIWTLVMMAFFLQARAQTSVTAVSTCGKTYYIRVSFTDMYIPKHSISTTTCQDGSVHNNTEESQYLDCTMELFADAACLVPVPVDPRYFAYCNCITASHGTRLQPTFLYQPDCSAALPAGSEYGGNRRTDHYLIYTEQCSWDCATGKYTCARSGPGVPTTYNIVMNCCFGPGTLAVQLTSFEGVRRSGVNTLRWSLENRQDFVRLVLERSFDGVRYEVIYATPDVSISSHQDVVAATAYYRLKLYNTNGTFFISPVVVLKAEAVRVFSVLPSPFGDVLQVTVAAMRYIPSVFKLVAADGRVVFETLRALQAGVNSIVFQVPPMAKGVYILLLQNEEGTAVRKLVKQ